MKNPDLWIALAIVWPMGLFIASGVQHHKKRNKLLDKCVKACINIEDSNIESLCKADCRDQLAMDPLNYIYYPLRITDEFKRLPRIDNTPVQNIWIGNLARKKPSNNNVVMIPVTQ